MRMTGKRALPLGLSEDGAASDTGLETAGVNFLYFAPPPELQHLVCRFYIYSCEPKSLAITLPAGLAQVYAVLEGQSARKGADGQYVTCPSLGICGPSSSAVGYAISGPHTILGAVMTPIGVHAMCDGSVHKIVDQLLKLDSFVKDGALVLHKLKHLHQEAKNLSAGHPYHEQMVREFSDFILANAAPVCPSAVAQLQILIQWLESSFIPPLDELTERLGMSERQVQRFVKEYFGVSPKFLSRKNRALRVSTFMRNADLAEEELEQLKSHFYDQSHMIRELRHFIGFTPGDLSKPSPHAVAGHWLTLG